MNRKLTQKSETSQKKSIEAILSTRLASLIPVLISLLIGLPVLQNDFVNWDDNLYVYENMALIQGRFWDAILIPIQGNYHPFTQLSLWLDFQIDGLNPKVFHLSSLLWHCLVVWLAGRLAYRVSGNHTLAFFVALGFGIHPLHVESFAWISSRKDLLYSAASFGTLLYWLDFQEKKSFGKIIVCLLFFTIALLSKPMAVILPLLMGLMIIFPSGKWLDSGTIKFDWSRQIIPILLLIPALGLMYFTYQAQHGVGAVREVNGLGMWENMQIATHGFWFYWVKGLVPFSLSAFYPYPPVGQILPFKFLFAFFLFFISLIAWIKWNKNLRFYLPGVLWMLICLLPVLQLIPVGSAIVAERYFYLAAWGFLMVLGMILLKLIHSEKNRLGIYTAFLLVWAVTTMQRIPVWKNGGTLFKDVLTQFPENPTAANNLGNWLEKNGQRAESCKYYELAVAKKPDFPQALFNLALCRQEQGALEEAKYLNLKAVQYKPDFADPWNNLATIYGSTGLLDSAHMALEQTLRIRPNYAAAWNNLGMYYLAKGIPDSARQSFRRSLEIDNNPNSDAARNLKYLEAEKK